MKIPLLKKKGKFFSNCGILLICLRFLKKLHRPLCALIRCLYPFSFSLLLDIHCRTLGIEATFSSFLFRLLLFLQLQPLFLNMNMLIGVFHCGSKRISDNIHRLNRCAAMLCYKVILLFNVLEEVLGNGDVAGVKVKCDFHLNFSFLVVFCSFFLKSLRKLLKIIRYLVYIVNFDKNTGRNRKKTTGTAETCHKLTETMQKMMKMQENYTEI